MKLATPRHDGSLSLERCMAQRRSVRSFGNQALTKDELGQLLWAAQGLTGSDGSRTGPSAGALYPLELYAAAGDVASLPAGVYRYAAERHELVPRAAGFRSGALVAAAHGQDWIAAAPLCLCIAAVFERMTFKYGERGRGFVYMEAGPAADNVMLQAVALGLASTMAGAFDDDKVGRVLGLDPNVTPLCLLPVEDLNPMMA